MTTTIGSAIAMPILTAPPAVLTTVVSIPILGGADNAPSVTASVLSAVNGATMYVLNCPDDGDDACKLGQPTITVAPTAYDFHTVIEATDSDSSTITYATHCALSQSVMAACSFTNVVAGSTQITTTSDLTSQSDYDWMPLTITAGAEKLTGAQYFPTTATTSVISRSVVSVIPVAATPTASANAASRNRRFWL